MGLNVHEELVFYVPLEELSLVGEIQRVMENPSVARVLRVPLVVEMSHSTTSWRDKVKGLPPLAATVAP
jgi:DNA polymerase I-like protein with 3'-5' exonuclease and polymerase domains